MKRRFYRILNKVNREKARMRLLDDGGIRAMTAVFKERLAAGASLDSLLPEAFAVVCEADRRLLGKDPYDCQILGAIALHFCYLAEMNTGEGKTLTATMPLYLNALTGKSSILVTANEYLAVRDAEEMRPVYEFLGLSVRAGVEREGEKFSNDDKKAVYGADIVYTTHGALGFDYLFNNLVSRAEDRFLREFYYVIIDEADSVLLDAAQMPLVIAGAPRVQSNLYGLADFFVTTLKEERDYIEEERSVWLTDEGVAYAERFFGIRGFYARENFEINRHVTLALRAHVLMERNRDYVISEKGEVTLLDNGTGRLMPGMKLRGGIHQALEAKEKVDLTQETRSVAAITYQNLFLMFPRMSGMSGTIADARRELRTIYKKSVVTVPPNRPIMREDKPDRFFRRAEEQYGAAVEEILRRHKNGQPVLVVTSSIAGTQLISRLLVEKQVAHSVLNANNAYWEAQIIREAGQKGAVTVSTGMAGRGTDIRLGPGAKELGGLAVIGIGRMANVRLERQARGRAGRQGDPGCSQFFVSLEDDVVAAAGEKTLEKYVDHGHRISSRKLRRLINGTRNRQEETAVSLRQMSVDYDKVIRRQRNMMYDVRNRLLDGESLRTETVERLAAETTRAFVRGAKRLLPGDINRYILNNLSYTLDNRFLHSGNMKKKELERAIRTFTSAAWRRKKDTFASQDELDAFVRLCTLKAVDDAWVEQIDYLQQLQAVVGGRATAQRNPVFEYHAEAYLAFMRMQDTIRRDIVRNVFLGEAEYTKTGEMYVLFP